MDEEKNEFQTLDDVEKPVKKEYVINISGGGKNREIRLGSGLYNFGIFTFFVGLIIFIGACGYSIYSFLNVQRNASIVRDIQQAEELQQEQLLSISKKASELSEAVQNLTQQEQELRIQAGLNPPKEDKPLEWGPPTDETSASTEENSAPTDTTPVEENVWQPPTDENPTSQVLDNQTDAPPRNDKFILRVSLPEEKDFSEMSAEEVTAEARIIWQKYLTLTQELLKFINKQDIDTFLELVPQRDRLIELDKKLPSREYRQLQEFKDIAEQIKPMDREIMYKARAWLNKSRRQNSAVRSYDLTNSMLGTQGVAFNRTY